MKKSLLATFAATALLLPVYLLRAREPVRARNPVWEKKEADFRRDLAYKEFSPSVELERPDQSGSYNFPWKPAEWTQILSQVHLMRARSHFDPKRISYKISFSSGDYVHDTQAIRLDANRDRGWIELESPYPKQGKKWNGYELTSASCHFLKQQIWAKYGSEFRALAKLRHLTLVEPKA